MNFGCHSTVCVNIHSFGIGSSRRAEFEVCTWQKAVTAVGCRNNTDIFHINSQFHLMLSDMEVIDRCYASYQLGLSPIHPKVLEQYEAVFLQLANEHKTINMFELQELLEAVLPNGKNLKYHIKKGTTGMLRAERLRDALLEGGFQRRIFRIRFSTPCKTTRPLESHRRTKRRRGCCTKETNMFPLRFPSFSSARNTSCDMMAPSLQLPWRNRQAYDVVDVFHRKSDSDSLVFMSFFNFAFEDSGEINMAEMTRTSQRDSEARIRVKKTLIFFQFYLPYVNITRRDYICISPTFQYFSFFRFFTFNVVTPEESMGFVYGKEDLRLKWPPLCNLHINAIRRWQHLLLAEQFDILTAGNPISIIATDKQISIIATDKQISIIAITMATEFQSSPLQWQPNFNHRHRHFIYLLFIYLKKKKKKN
uniref:Uncharacterized protein n=1 Tax=Strigamia maritima TaxID=126957 RepID=T1IPI3_STRMM